MIKPGLFFSFDGVDGAGKSTQIQYFCEWLEARRHEIVVCRDPGSTRLGEAVREILLGASYPIGGHAEMLLYMACRAQLVHEVIRPSLQQGKTVVSDRFVLANVVYQGCAGDVDVAQIWQVGQIATQGATPDMTFVLDVDPDQAAKRLPQQLDRMERRGRDYFVAVRRGFLEQAEQHPERICVIDASGDVQTVQAEVRRRAERVLDAARELR